MTRLLEDFVELAPRWEDDYEEEEGAFLHEAIGKALNFARSDSDEIEPRSDEDVVAETD